MGLIWAPAIPLNDRLHCSRNVISCDDYYHLVSNLNKNYCLNNNCRQPLRLIDIYHSWNDINFSQYRLGFSGFITPSIFWQQYFFRSIIGNTVMEANWLQENDNLNQSHN